MASSTVESSSSREAMQHNVVNESDDNLLKKHVAFFDRNKDGFIYPWETYQGCRAIGLNFFISVFAAFFVNSQLGPGTRPGRSCNLFSCFSIEVKNIQKVKHGSDSGVYDTEGRFVPTKFEEIFSKHAKTSANALTSNELKEMLQANKEPKGYFMDRIAANIEWQMLYKLCKDKDGLLQKEKIRAVYDGSIFEQLANERTSAAKRS